MRCCAIMHGDLLLKRHFQKHVTCFWLPSRLFYFDQSAIFMHLSSVLHALVPSTRLFSCWSIIFFLPAASLCIVLMIWLDCLTEYIVPLWHDFNCWASIYQISRVLVKLLCVWEARYHCWSCMAWCAGFFFFSCMLSNFQSQGFKATLV